MTPRTQLFTPVLAIAAAGLLAACSSFTPAPPAGGLPAGLTQAMDVAGATLDRPAALALINAYRATTNAVPLNEDAALAAQAQALADQYARTGTPPSLPGGFAAMRLSAGYDNFADTFSGWRGSAADARVLADPLSRRAGLGVTYNAASAYGVHWVLVLAP